MFTDGVKVGILIVSAGERKMQEIKRNAALCCRRPARNLNAEGRLNVRKEVYHMYETMRQSRNTVKLSDITPIANVRCRLCTGAGEFETEPLTLAAASRRSGVRLAAAGREGGARAAGARRSQRMM